jgi:hypothetical protein
MTAENQRHSIARGQTNQFPFLIRRAELSRVTNNLLQLAQELALPANEQFRVADNIDEQDMPDLQTLFCFRIFGHGIVKLHSSRRSRTADYFQCRLAEVGHGAHFPCSQLSTIDSVKVRGSNGALRSQLLLASASRSSLTSQLFCFAFRVSALHRFISTPQLLNLSTVSFSFQFSAFQLTAQSPLGGCHHFLEPRVIANWGEIRIHFGVMNQTSAHLFQRWPEHL